MKKNLFISLITSLLILAFAFTAVNDAQAAQVTFLRAGTGNDVTNTTTLPVPFPSPIASGNLILMQIAIRNTTIGVTTPAGWTLLYGPDTAGTTIRQWIFYKIADGSETGNLNVTVGSGNILKMGRMYLFNNTDSSNFTEGGGFGTGTVATISAQSVITTGIERLAVSFVFVDDDNALDPFTGESGGDWTEGVAEYTTTSGADGAMGLQIAIMATAGTISGGTDTMGASDTWGVRAFALKPLPTGGTPDHLVFSVQPSDATAGVAISPNVAVEIRDSLNQLVNDNTTQVSLSIGSNPGGGTLTGTDDSGPCTNTCTVRAVAGVATFTNLKIDNGGTGYTLIATAASLPNPTTTSNTFNIRGPSKLAFSVQPQPAPVDVPISPAIEVRILDSLDNLVPIATNTVTMSIDPTTPDPPYTGGGTLSGTTSVAAVAGTATFSNLSINLVASNYKLIASSVGLTSVTSTVFNINAGTFGSTVCAGERYGGDLNCTAGDVRITAITIADTTPAPTCTGGETITLDLDVTINFNQAGKYDVGVFMSNDGLDPQYPVANGGSTSCKVNTLPITAGAAAPWPPFEDLDGPTDTCGEGSSGLSNKLRMSNVTVLCQTYSGISNAGKLFIPFVVSWDVNKTPPGKVCTSITDPVPSQAPKCNSPAENIDLGVITGTAVLPSITKTDNKTTLASGESTTYTVVVTNSTGVTLTNAVFTDPAVAAPAVLTVPVNGVTCSYAGGATCPVSCNPCDVSLMQGAGLTIPTMPSSSPQAITGITRANPAVVTYSGADNYANSDRVIISNVVGMTAVNDKEFTVANVNTGANTFQLSGVNSSSYAAYTSGGTILKVSSVTFTINATLVSNPNGMFTNTATIAIPSGNAAASDSVGGSGTGTGGSRVRVIKWREVFR